MNVQRKVTLVIATGAIAFGAGHFVQKRAAEHMAAAAPVVVSAVETLAAGPTDPAAPMVVELMAPVSPTVVERAPIPAAPTFVPGALAPAVANAVADFEPDENLPSSADAASECSRQLDLIEQPGAMIGVTLLSPCNPNERVVLRHAGLAVTGRTTASGAYFATLPALTAVSEVQVLFASGELASASIDMPDAAALHRFGIQWQASDAFQLNAFENGAGYDQPGHISAAFTGTAGEGSFLSILGDSTTDLPLLAEVYTFGTDPNADMVIEAAVTPETCGREIMGETLAASGGSVEITDLTMAMPDCDAIGDILVLKNPEQDMTLAAAD